MSTKLLLILFLASLFSVRAQDTKPWKPTLTIERVNNPKQLDGHWALSSGWAGFMGLALELRDGRFRYWFMSDVGSPDDKPKYPFTGTFTVQHGFLVLNTKQSVYDTRWLLVTHDGRTGLFPFDAFETITMQRESPHNRMLFRVTDAEAKQQWPRYNVTK